MDTSETYIKMCDCEEIQEGTAYLLDGSDFRTPNGIWLPRQDQLQEMVSYIGDTWVIEQYFHNYLHSIYTHERKDSMEQLWLAFVMKEKHNKVWDGDKWTT